jgi:hypothetical protein
VARVLEAMCGVSTALSSASRPARTFGSSSYTSSPAAASRPSRSAAASASSSTTPPRAMLTSTAVGFIRASSAAPIRCCVSLPPGTAMIR